VVKATPVVLTTKAQAQERGGYTLAEALEPPCLTCETSPCCTYLPLRTFEMKTLQDVDYARYLLNFEAIELGVASSGDWSVYYRRPCRHLDTETLGCGVHAQPEQPSVCQHYNPYSCWYRKALVPVVSPDFFRIDRGRLEVLASTMLFDDARTIVKVADWDELTARFAELPVVETVPSASAPDPVLERWRAEAVGTVPTSDPVRVTMASLAGSPCDSCSAPCCDTLTFAATPPATVASVDFLRFVLGFPGAEVGVAGDGTWQTVVKTRCRHLVDGRCSIYGQPERPILCSYFDANHCTTRVTFGRTRPASFVRVRFEQLPVFEDLFHVDAAGNVVKVPTTEEIRDAIESRWREEAFALVAAGVDEAIEEAIEETIEEADRAGTATAGASDEPDEPGELAVPVEPALGD